VRKERWAETSLSHHRVEQSGFVLPDVKTQSAKVVPGAGMSFLGIAVFVGFGKIDLSARTFRFAGARLARASSF
jgi:hypothetical protein